MSEWIRALELTTVSSCAVNCSFCPQGVLRDAYRGPRTLRLEDFRAVVDRLPRDVVLHFSGFVEPWLNPDCTEMLRDALEAGRRVAVYTTTIGMRDPGKVRALLDEHRALVDHVCLHLPDREGNMPTEPHESAIEVFRGFPGLEVMAMGSPSAAVQGRGLPRLPIWNPIDRAGNLTGNSLPRVRHVGPIRCSYTPTYEHNVMLPNGDVVLCCMDYGLKHPLGNLLTHAWEDLDEARRRVSYASFATSTTLCRNCHGAEPC